MLKKFIQEAVPGIVQSYIDEGLFPQFPDNPYSSLQKEDLKTVVEEVYCIQPSIFHKTKKEHKKVIIGCLNLILKTEERENIITILDSIQQLTAEERQQLADVLRKYELQSVVKLLNTIETRYMVINKLKTLIYDNAKFTTERDHIQKTIEQNYWLFGEEYSLISADERIDSVLHKYMNYLDKTNVTDVSYDDPQYMAKRPDIFMAGNQITAFNLQENIIVELKAPNVKLSMEVYRQIEDYMLAIKKDPEFNSIYKIWKFICVCKELTDDIKDKIESFKQYGKKGLVNIQSNFEIYAYSWSDIFAIFELRHNHLYSKLKKQISYTQTLEKITPSRKVADTVTKDILNISNNAS